MELVEIKRLLAERPNAFPRMPTGSPGMEVEGSPPQAYEVLLLDRSGQRVFARFRGGQQV